mmetsp:Transcript_3415/g.6601  ORF Transcript_3415/g.6601 Transcript_3415/m.6601 type:complete len:156 (+) Transcript_3415:263-730(+)
MVSSPFAVSLFSVLALAPAETVAFTGVATRSPIQPDSSFNVGTNNNRLANAWLKASSEDEEEADDDDGWGTSSASDKERELAALQLERQQRQEGSNRAASSSKASSSSDSKDDEQERDLFIPIFALVSLAGLFGSYGYEMARLYSRGELYLPWEQ